MQLPDLHPSPARRDGRLTVTRIPLDQVAALVVEGASDSRHCMKAIAKLLGLDEAATEEQILEALGDRLSLADIAKALELKDDASREEILDAIKAANEKADAGEMSLEDRAKAEGKRVVDASEHDQLVSDAKAGREAADKLHQRDFDDAFEKALDEVRVDAKDSTREEWQELYDAAPEATLKRLAGLPKLANTKPAGKGGADEVPEGVDEDRHKLDKRVKDRMAEKDEDYTTALDAVLNEMAEETD